MSKTALKLATTEKPKFPYSEAESLLKQFEAAELEIAQLMAENEEVFARIKELNDEQDVVKESLKRLCYDKKGPPPGLKGKVFRPVGGEILELEITYKQKNDYYDPRLLPPDVLMKPGIISEVDKVAIDSLGDERCNQALVAGEWLTPSLSIKRKR